MNTCITRSSILDCLALIRNNDRCAEVAPGLPDHDLGIIAAHAVHCVSAVTVVEINRVVPDTEHPVSLVGDWRVRDDRVAWLAEPVTERFSATNQIAGTTAIT
jgi:hypothetical protein